METPDSRRRAGAIVTSARKRSRLTQRELARRADISETWLRAMTKGLRDEDPQRASDEVWVALAHESGADVREVFRALGRPLPTWLSESRPAVPENLQGDDRYAVTARWIDTPFGRVLEEIAEDLESDTEDWGDDEVAEAEKELAATFQRQYAAYMQAQEALRERRRRRAKDAD